MSTLLAFDQAAALDAELGGSGSRGVFGDLGLTGKLLARTAFFEAVARQSYGPWELAQRARRAEGVADAMVQHLAERRGQSKGGGARLSRVGSLAVCGSSLSFRSTCGCEQQAWVGGRTMHARRRHVTSQVWAATAVRGARQRRGGGAGGMCEYAWCVSMRRSGAHARAREADAVGPSAQTRMHHAYPPCTHTT